MKILILSKMYLLSGIILLAISVQTPHVRTSQSFFYYLSYIFILLGIIGVIYWMKNKKNLEK